MSEPPLEIDSAGLSAVHRSMGLAVSEFAVSGYSSECDTGDGSATGSAGSAVGWLTSVTGVASKALNLLDGEMAAVANRFEGADKSLVMVPGVRVGSGGGG